MDCSIPLSEIQSTANLVIEDCDGWFDDNGFNRNLFVLAQRNLSRSEICELLRVALPTFSRCWKTKMTLEYITQNRGNMELQTMFPKLLYTKMEFHYSPHFVD